MPWITDKATGVRVHVPAGDARAEAVKSEPAKPVARTRSTRTKKTSDK